jgi:hypothetical protein
MVEAIMIALRIVPIPGTCLRGIQKIRIPILIRKVVVPTERSVLIEIPCAKTVQGLTPDPLPMIIASPKPKKKSPVTNIMTV